MNIINRAKILSPEMHSHVEALKKRDKNQKRKNRVKHKSAFNADGRLIEKKKKWNFKPVGCNQKLYLIGCADCFKVGISTDPYKRLASLQTGNPMPCQLLAIWEPKYAPTLEKEIHKQLKNHRVRGEWFSIKIFDHACRQIAGIVGADPSFIFERTHQAGCD